MSVRKSIVVLLMVLFVFSISGAQLPERYTRYSQALETLAELRDTYPEVCKLDTMGYSTRDSLPMLRFKISDNVLVDEDEPAIFYCGGVHADEVLAVEVVMWFIQDIMEKYSQQDPAALRYIDSLEIFCIPFINPEGHTAVEQGIMDWRKNKCDNDSNGVFDIHDGVDNNRNYDFGWSIDTAPDAIVPESLQYKGTAPFTQTENVAMAAFAWRYRPIVALDYHSPTYGRSEVAYYPWYWYANQGGHGFGPDEAMMAGICRQYASRIVDDAGDSTYEARRALVDKGDFKTYFYGNFGTVVFSVEISDTTIQDSSIVDSICERHLPAEYYLLGRALGSGISGVIRDSVTLEPLEAEVQVLEHVSVDIHPRLSRPDYGRYRRILDPGTYTLRFLKSGYQTRTVNNVVVSSNRLTVVDKLLPPTNPRPPAPALIFPAQDTSFSDTTIAFAWHTASFAQKYLFEVYSDSQLTVPLHIDSLVTDTSIVIDIMPVDNSVFWRVKGGNTYGWGPYSITGRFNIEITPPAPIQIFPPDDTILTDSAMTFSWLSAPSAMLYLLEIYSDSTLYTPIQIDSSITDTFFVSQAPVTDTTVYWRIKSGNSNGWGAYSPTWSFIYYRVTDLDEAPVPKALSLEQNYPNPFNARTVIAADIPSGLKGSLAIFDISGRVVREFNLSGSDNSERQIIVWDSKDYSGNPVSSGVYFYRLKVGDSAIARKMILLR